MWEKPWVYWEYKKGKGEMKTVTFNPLTHKLVSIEPTEQTIQALCLRQSSGDFGTYRAWWNSHSSSVAEKIRGFLIGDYKAMIAAAPDYPAAGWIPVSERLPEMNVPVLTSSGFGVTAHCRVDLGDGNWGWGVPQYSNLSDCRNYECDDDYAVNSWMNFPAAPKGKE